MPKDLARIPVPLQANSAVLLSPHLDDALLSAHYLLSAWPELEAWTVFAGRPVPIQQTEWDRRSGFADSDIALDARLEEEENAFEGLPNPRRYFDLVDDQYRSASPDLTTVIDALTAWAGASPGPRLVVLPVAAGIPPSEESPAQAAGPIGRTVSLAQRAARKALSRKEKSERPHIPAHPDHRAVRDALLPVVRDLDVTLALYEDLPYHLAYPGSEVVSGHPVLSTIRFEHVTVAGDRDAKARSVAAYTSQLAGISVPGRSFDRAEGHERTENFWVALG